MAGIKIPTYHITPDHSYHVFMVVGKPFSGQRDQGYHTQPNKENPLPETVRDSCVSPSYIRLWKGS